MIKSSVIIPAKNLSAPLGNGAPGRNRTCDPQLRRLVLYPLSYGRRRNARHYIPSVPCAQLSKLVGVEGFEPPTPCSQSRCATRLRYTPIGTHAKRCSCEPHQRALANIVAARPVRRRHYTHRFRERQSGVADYCGGITHFYTPDGS